MTRFADLLAPMAPEDFFRTHWEKRPLVLNRSEPNRHAALLGLAEVDRILTADDLAFPRIRLARGEDRIDPADFTFAGGRIDALAVTKLFGDGTTIIFDQLQRRVPALRDLCGDLEDELGVAFHTNIYLTPPKARGFKVHYDTHDVFILQLAGAKEWEVFESPIELPLTGQTHDQEGRVPGVLIDRFRLEPGDLAYLPRGIYHQAASDDEASLHITLGVVERSWCALMLEAVSEASLRDVELRRALPVGFGLPDFDPAAAEAEFRRLWARLTEQVDFAAVGHGFQQRGVRSQERCLEGQLLQTVRLAEVSDDSLLAARPQRVLAAAEPDGCLTVETPAISVTFPAVARAAVEALLSGRALRPRDFPGRLDRPGRLALARRMIREGLIRLVDEPTPRRSVTAPEHNSPARPRSP